MNSEKCRPSSPPRVFRSQTERRAADSLEELLQWSKHAVTFSLLKMYGSLYGGGVRLIYTVLKRFGFWYTSQDEAQ